MSQYKPTIQFDIPRKADAAVLAGVAAVLAESKLKAESLNYTPDWSASATAIPWETMSEDPNLQAILVENSILLNTMVCSLKNRVTLVVNRPENQSLDRVTIQLNALNQAPPADPKQIGLFIAAARKHLGSLLTEDRLALADAERREDFIARNAAVGQLESTLTNVAQQFTKDAAEQRSSLLREIETERATTREGLKIERANQELELRVEREKLDAAALKLEERLKLINDKEAKHERRQIRKDIKTELETRSSTFELTPGTRALRYPVAFVSLSLMGLFAILFSYAAWKSINTKDFEAAAVARQVALGLALASSTVFYLRWQNRWFEQHAQEEFRLKRMALDVDRASWVVEMAMEWKEDKESELPTDLLNKLSANLFEESGRKDEALHPADQLASALLGASSRVKLPLPGGGELELGSKGIKSLEQTTIKGT